MKLTGKNITVAVVDNGVFHEHQDLKDNFDMKNSYDYVSKKDTPEPPNTEDNHGTMCAGAIAGAKNDVCGVGVAFNAKIAGLRIMDAVQSVKHSDEAKAMNHGFQDVSIYSYSFGPEDDGETLGPEVYVLEQALLKGVNEGRGGKGSVFVFSAGNGGLPVIGDNCGYDGYINSIHSIAVGALDHTGNHAPFSELCASVMVVTSGGWDDRNIATIDTTDDKACNTEDFVGTSSSSALAAGVFALALEARPDLTWRDMQHLCVNTARVVHEGADWERMESGRRYSYKYGFGALDAYEFVKAAKTWELVKPQTWIKTKPVQLRQGLLPGMGKGTMDATGAFSGGKPLSGTAFSESVKVTKEMVDAADFDVIEHVQVKVWIQHSRRGDIEVEIESPGSKKVVSLLGMKRPNDKADTGLRGWTFTSLKHWGEQPLGDWVLRFKDQGNENKGNVIGFSVTFWGSARKDSKDPVLFKLPVDDKNVFPPVSK